MAVVEKSRYVPASYSLYKEYPELGIEIFIDAPRNCALGFSGRRNKSDFNYRFPNAERMIDYCDKFIAQKIKFAEMKKQQKAEQLAKNRSAKVNVGDIFASYWGYEQSNVDYYQVIAVNGQMVDVREISGNYEGNGLPDQGNCVPVPDSFKGDKVLRKRIKVYGENPCFRVASYANAYRKDPVAVIDGVKIFKEDFWSSYY